MDRFDEMVAAKLPCAGTLYCAKPLNTHGLRCPAKQIENIASLLRDEVGKEGAENERLKAELDEAQTKIRLLEQDNRYWRLGGNS